MAPPRCRELAVARTAKHVFVDQQDVARLKAMVAGLGNGDRVSLYMADGEVVQGIVSVRPSLQVFHDPAGREGANAVLRLSETALEQPMTAGWRDLWVGDIREVRHHHPS